MNLFQRIAENSLILLHLDPFRGAYNDTALTAEALGRVAPDLGLCFDHGNDLCRTRFRALSAAGTQLLINGYKIHDRPQTGNSRPLVSGANAKTTTPSRNSRLSTVAVLPRVM